MATSTGARPALNERSAWSRWDWVRRPWMATALTSARASWPATRSAPWRGRVVPAIGRSVEDTLDALARLVTREVGKPLAEARGEVQEIVQQPVAEALEIARAAELGAAAGADDYVPKPSADPGLTPRVRNRLDRARR